MARILQAICCRKRLFALALMLAPVIAQAEMPPHLVLHRPTATAHSSPYSKPVLVPAQPYPYGYFGAACTWPQWKRQFGIHRTYTQWSQK